MFVNGSAIHMFVTGFAIYMFVTGAAMFVCRQVLVQVRIDSPRATKSGNVPADFGGATRQVSDQPFFTSSRTQTSSISLTAATYVYLSFHMQTPRKHVTYSDREEVHHECVCESVCGTHASDIVCGFVSMRSFTHI